MARPSGDSVGHLLRNKRLYGMVCVGLAVALAILDQLELATGAAILAAFLIGAGAMRSDEEVKARE